MAGINYPKGLLNNIVYKKVDTDDWLFGKFIDRNTYVWRILNNKNQVTDWGYIDVTKGMEILLRFVMELVKDGWQEIHYA